LFGDLAAPARRQLLEDGKVSALISPFSRRRSNQAVAGSPLVLLETFGAGVDPPGVVASRAKSVVGGQDAGLHGVVLVVVRVRAVALDLLDVFTTPRRTGDQL
jgi:hypothetical protein